VRLAVRIAREIHLPVTAVLQLPAREMNIWAAVFAEEAREGGEHEETAEESEDDISGAAAFRLMGGDINFRGQK
jgi:stringent starvation protein B